MGKRIWRKVISYESYSHTNNPHPLYPCSLFIKLECGHELRRKSSEGVPKKAACWECESEQRQREFKALQSERK